MALFSRYHNFKKLPGYEVCNARAINATGVVIGDCGVDRVDSSSNVAIYWPSVEAEPIALPTLFGVPFVLPLKWRE